MKNHDAEGVEEEQRQACLGKVMRIVTQRKKNNI